MVSINHSLIDLYQLNTDIPNIYFMNKTKKYKCLQLTPRNSHPGVGKKIGIQGKNKTGSNVTHLL